MALKTLNNAQAALAVGAFVLTAIFFRERPPTPSSRASMAGQAAAPKGGTSLRALWRDTVAAVAAPGMGSLLVLFAFAVSTYWTLSVLLNETLSAKGFSSREIMLPGVMLRPTRLRLHTRPPASACASHKLVVWCIYMQVCLGRLNSM